MTDQKRGSPIDARYLEEALRFLDDACSSWHALAAKWGDAGEAARAADALEHARECDRRRVEVIAALGRMTGRTPMELNGVGATAAERPA